jgi:prepilin-type N-terminal cleavage/methylation domain-containing protein
MTMHIRRRTCRGFSLLELTIVLTIMGVLIAVPAPMFGRAIEQPKLDVAASNLRSIWAAERFYYLETGRYGTLSDLAADTLASDLVDPTILNSTAFYSYVIAPASGGQSFIATATRPTSAVCSGTVTIDQAGNLACGVVYAGQVMTPSLEPTP